MPRLIGSRFSGPILSGSWDEWAQFESPRTELAWVESARVESAMFI